MNKADNAGRCEMVMRSAVEALQDNLKGWQFIIVAIEQKPGLPAEVTTDVSPAVAAIVLASVSRKLAVVAAMEAADLPKKSP